MRGDYEILACPYSPPNKPIDAATNEEDGKACTCERTWSRSNNWYWPVSSNGWNAQCQQQGHRNNQGLHDSILRSG